MNTVDPVPTAEETSSEEPPETYVFLSPDAVPRRRNQVMAMGLAAVAVLVLGFVVTLILLIRYDNLPSLLSYFS